MLFETSLTSSRTKGKRTDWLAESLTGLRGLLRFLAVLGLLFAVAYLYFEQVNAITSIRNETAELHQQAATLERENVALMVQLAAWNRPEYIRSKALEQGLVPLDHPVYVQVPTAEQTEAKAHQQVDLTSWWQHWVGQLTAGWSSPDSSLAPGETGP